MNNFQTTIKTLENGIVLEIRKYSTHWGFRALRNGSVIAIHSGNNSNQSYKYELISRYQACKIANSTGI